MAVTSKQRNLFGLVLSLKRKRRKGVKLNSNLKKLMALDDKTLKQLIAGKRKIKRVKKK